MPARCPACAEPIDFPAEEGGSCGACGHLWAPVLEGPPLPSEPVVWELQHAIGDPVQGPFDRNRIRQNLYVGLLTGDERIRRPGGTFERLGDRPEFAQVLALVGRTAPAGGRGTGGWKPAMRMEAAPRTASPPAPEPVAPALPGLTPDLETDPAPRSRLVPLLLGAAGIGAVLLLAAVLAGWFLLTRG